MQLTRAADYAVRVMIHLATLPQGTRVQRNTLAEATAVPESFMSKVLQGLVRARLITSWRGIEGGFELSAAPDKITLLHVVEAIEGPIQLNFCLGSADACDRHSWCAAHLVWAEAQAAMVKVLKSASIERLARQTMAGRCRADGHAADQSVTHPVEKHRREGGAQAQRAAAGKGVGKE